MLTDIKVYKTEDYSKFKIMNGNRNIDLKNVNNIVNNITKNGLLPTIIIVNENMEVIDGQHRLEAFKRLNLPVHYCVHEGLTLKDCVAYNVSSQHWKINDYIESYAQLGYIDYIKLNQLIRDYPHTSIGTIAGLCFSKYPYAVGGGLTKAISEGRFKFKVDVLEVTQKLSIIKSFEKLNINIRGRKNIFSIMLAGLCGTDLIDTDRMLIQLEKYGYLIDTIADSKEALEKLQEVYNFHKQQKIRFVDDYLNLSEK